MKRSELILGPRGSRSRRRFLFASIVSAGLLGIFVIASALAVHEPPDSSFELDGNATSQGRDDWDRVNAGTDSANVDTGIVVDPLGTTIFTGGGSKDDLDVSSWKHKSGSVPPKDEISDAYAALYNVGGELRLYFGADRFANNGSSQIGFWFFQDSIGLNPDGTFSGVHDAGVVPHSDTNPGDILILSDFTQGGAISTIRVFEWVGSGGSAGAVNQVAAGVDCITAVHPPDLCGTVNSANAAAPWDYSPKFGTDGTFPPGSLYEGGVDLSAFGFENICLSSFLAETRSSPSVDATLKDFVLGSLPSCGSTTVTQPVDGSGTSKSSIALGEDIFDKATVTGTGGASANPGGTVTFSVCGPTDPSSTVLCTDGGTQVSVETLPGTSNPGVVTSDAFTPTAVGRYCFRADYSGDTVNGYPASSDSGANECFTVTQVQPTISTAQTFTVKDSATISASGGGNLAGSVRFRLYPNSDCSGTTTLVDQTVNVSGASPQTVSTTPLEITTSKPTLSWLVEYTSTNPNQTNVTSTCATERSSLTIVNG